jgi:hypothetical protein
MKKIEKSEQLPVCLFLSYHCLLPILEVDYVAERVINAIQLNKDIVLVPRMLNLLLGLKGLVGRRRCDYN